MVQFQSSSFDRKCQFLDSLSVFQVVELTAAAPRYLSIHVCAVISAGGLQPVSQPLITEFLCVELVLQPFQAQ